MNSSSAIKGKEDFAITFGNAVHGGLDKVLGHMGAEAVLLHMQMADSLPDPAEFHRKLLALFGEAATLSLERAIVKDLAVRLRWALDVLKIKGAFDFEATMRSIKEDIHT